MILIFLLEIICDITFYMVFANISSQVFFEVSINSLLPLLIMAISASCAYLLRQARTWRRYLALLLLPLCFLGQHSIVAAIVLLLPCVYIALTIWQENFNYEISRLRKKIGLCSILIFLPLVAALFNNGYEALYSLQYFHYLFIYIGCAICVLRIARSDAKTATDMKFILISIAPVIVCLAALAIAGSPRVLAVLWQAVSFIWLNIIAPVIMFTGRLLSLLLPTIDYRGDRTVTNDYSEKRHEEGIESELVGAPLPDYILTIIQWILIILVIVFAIFVLRKVISSLKKRSLLSSPGFSEIRSSAMPMAEEMPANMKQSLFTPRNPRLAVRHHYRRFLKLCAERGHPPHKGDTTIDINSKNEKYFPAVSMAKLRELYIKARYSEHVIESGESKEAGELVKHLQGRME